MSRYSSVDEIKAGRIGSFRGVRYLETAWQDYFNSTTNVFPTTVLSKDAFGWGYYQTPTPILTTTPDSNNPLNLFTSIGGKVSLGVTRFEDPAGLLPNCTHRKCRNFLVSLPCPFMGAGKA